MRFSSRLPRIVIIGRPNVGKSTLFNRLIGRKRALVHDRPGVTRDRIEEQARWIVGGRSFDTVLVDTGGLGGEKFDSEIHAQVKLALAEADIALVLFDGRTGLTLQDREVLKDIRRYKLEQNVPLVAVVNKIDTHKHESLISDFYEAGLDPIVSVSAEHDRGIDDLQETIVSCLGPRMEDIESTDAVSEEVRDQQTRIAIVGRPNVGKSTLLNALLGQERMITSPIAGTTVDAIDSEITLNGKKYIFIDTAGIRKKSKTEKGIEVLSVLQAKKALTRADLVILVLDGQTGPTDQDEKIGALIEDSGCSVIIAVNKWDTQKNNPGFSRKDAIERIQKQIRFLRYSPILFVSAREKTGYRDLGHLIEDVVSQRQIRISARQLSDFVRTCSTVHNPRNAKFYYSFQIGNRPPSFICHVSDPSKVHYSLRGHMINEIRRNWGFMGSPIRLKFVKSKGEMNARH